MYFLLSLVAMPCRYTTQCYGSCSIHGYANKTKTYLAALTLNVATSIPNAFSTTRLALESR